MNDDVGFIDAESSYGSKSDSFDFKGILMRHLERISRFASVEMRGSYKDIRQIPLGGTILTHEVTVPDARQIYINAVECLADLLYPHFDSEMRDSEELINKQIEEFSQSIKDDEEFVNQKRKLIRILFRSLCSFLYRNKYLEVGVMED